jgi:hypothetical protein
MLGQFAAIVKSRDRHEPATRLGDEFLLERDESL